MAEALSPVMQAALAADRERYNALFAAARRGTDLDSTRIMAWIREGIAPAVDAAAALRPERARDVLAALFESSLELTAQRVLGAGAQNPAVTAGWQGLLPALPALLAAEPAELSAAVVNALHRLASAEGARPEEWTAAMLRAGPHCADLSTFRDAGFVAAWRAGLAQYRAHALAVARRLDPAVLGSVLGIEAAEPGELAALLAVAERDPWRTLEELREGPWGEPRLALVGRVGAFRGFGGLFPLPPRVEARQGGLFACSGGGCWRLFADCYGAVFHREEGAPAAAPSPPAREESLVDDSGAVLHLGLDAAFPDLAGATSFASDGATLAVTVASSHAVYLVARR